MTASDGASKYKVVETPASGKVSCYEIDSSGTENLVSETTESDNSMQTKYYRGSATDTVTVNMSDYGNVTSMFYDGKAVEYGYFSHPTSGYASQMTYDSAGNPLQWKGNVLQWNRGRRLIGYGSNGYTYDSGGIRQSKTVNGITHTYYTEDGTIHKEELSDGNKLIYGYDESGIASIEYGNTRYYVQKNVQGDVVALVDGNKAVVAKYIYDAWGNHKVLDAAGTENTSDDFIGNINPIRYRGYYYDRETNLYYLINRYYDSETGRFISPDDISYLEPETIGGFNLYSYYWNNPLMYINSGTSFGSGEIVATSILAGDGGGIGLQRGRFVPEWLSIGVGAIPDIILGLKYLRAKGIHNKFVYSTNKFYMFPELGGNWHKYKISKYGYGKIASASFKQIITGNARSSWGAMAKSFGKTAALTAFINFGFNLYENNWQIDGVMLLNTVIDTAIGLGAYGLASGTTSLIVSGLAMAGLSVPGVVVVGAILLLSIGFDWLIREITGYKN